MEIKLNALTPEQFLDLYTAVGWEPPCIEQVRVALKNSLATFTAYDGGRAVGMVRLLGDGGMSFYVKDFAVLPAFQSRGVGSALLERLERHITELTGKKWAVSLELISTKEAAGFYARRGFEARPCDHDGPGMFKMIRAENKTEERT